MDAATMMFWEAKMEALPLYEAFERMILARFNPVTIRVQKTQISFDGERLFAGVSIARRWRREHPEGLMVLTLGLRRPLESPRVNHKIEIRPGRWTHHILLSREDELDEELFGWIAESWAAAHGPNRK